MNKIFVYADDAHGKLGVFFSELSEEKQLTAGFQDGPVRLFNTYEVNGLMAKWIAFVLGEADFEGADLGIITRDILPDFHKECAKVGWKACSEYAGVGRPFRVDLCVATPGYTLANAWKSKTDVLVFNPAAAHEVIVDAINSGIRGLKTLTGERSKP